MTLPRHPLWRALLALGGLVFLLATLVVGLALGAAVLLWSLLRGSKSRVRAGLGRRAAAPAAGWDVVEGQAREIARTK